MIRRKYTQKQFSYMATFRLPTSAVVDARVVAHKLYNFPVTTLIVFSSEGTSSVTEGNLIQTRLMVNASQTSCKDGRDAF